MDLLQPDFLCEGTLDVEALVNDFSLRRQRKIRDSHHTGKTHCRAEKIILVINYLIDSSDN